MKLYAVIGSGNCRKVQATIKHLGLDVDIEYLDFFAGDLNTPEFLALNPNGRVPTLTDADFRLWESNAIMQYLADTVSGNALFPQDPQTRADIVRWQCWELAHFNNAFAMLAYETVLKPRFMQVEPDPPIVAYAQESLSQFAAILDGHLADRDYVVGNAVTLADYSVVNMEGFKDIIPFDWSGYPQVNAWYDRLRAVPHWAQTAPANPEDMGRKPDAA